MHHIKSYIIICSFINIGLAKDTPLPRLLNHNSQATPEVLKFLAEESSIAKVGNNYSYNALGSTSQTNTILFNGSSSVGSMKKKKKIVISDMTLRTPLTQEIHARFEWNTTIASADYFLNNKKVSREQFDKLASIQEYSNSQESDVDVLRQVKELTADEIKELLKTKNNILISEYIEPTNLTIHSTVMDYTDFSIGLSNGYNGSGIGLYFTETGCANTSSLNLLRYALASSCLRGIQSHPTGVATVIQATSPGTSIFAFDQVNYPEPNNYTPALQIGSHSWGVGSNNIYGSEDMNMDNYIYNKRMINFVAAGNEAQSPNPNNYVSSPGKALNAITVGAIQPENGYYAEYSSWKNSEIGNQKPEIATYTNLDFPTNPTMTSYFGIQGRFSGTSAATPFAAAQASIILNQHPFLNRHPEMFKALLLTSSTDQFVNPAFDEDNTNPTVLLKGTPNYHRMATGFRSAYWNGSNSSYFDSNNEIRFTENVNAGQTYRVAISWLVPGTYIFQNKRISQDLDLFIYQGSNLLGASASGPNPYEIIKFTPTSSLPITVVIRRYSNSGIGDVILGYNLH